MINQEVDVVGELESFELASANEHGLPRPWPAPAKNLVFSLLRQTERGFTGPLAEIARIAADAETLLSIDTTGSNPDFDAIRAVYRFCRTAIEAHEVLSQQYLANNPQH